jgi:hypothetical protein
MPGKLISPRRRHVVWRMHNRGASHATINTFLKYQFGASQSVSSGSITNICAAGRQHGDPCHRAPRTTARSLNAGHAAVLGGALDVDASALTEELQDALSAAEPPGGRTSAPLADLEPPLPCIHNRPAPPALRHLVQEPVALRRPPRRAPEPAGAKKPKVRRKHSKSDDGAGPVTIDLPGGFDGRLVACCHSPISILQGPPLAPLS